ncbi:MAG: DUF6763 family protein [Steroidobacteraceae bacterium]
MNIAAPIVGDWYQDREGELFEVVALDADDHTIEVQYFDGTLEEFDGDDWIALLPREAEAPEDWTGPLDVEPEDHDDEAEPIVLPAWLGTGHLDRDEVTGYSEVPLG